MADSDPTDAQVVATFGERVWGPGWPKGMAEFTGINIRTLTRIKAASREGEDYAAARGVIGALREQLTAVLADLRLGRAARTSRDRP